MKKTSLNQNTATFKKLIAIVLVLVSLVCLLSSGFKIRVEIAGKKYTVDDIFRNAGTSRKEFEMNMRSELDDINDELVDFGLRINHNKLANLAGNLLDGKITLVDLAKSSSFINKALGKALKAQSSYDMWMMPMYQSMEELKNNVAIVAAVMWFFIAVAAATALYAIFAILTNKKRACLIYTIVVAVLLIAMAVLANVLNDQLRMVEYEMAALLEEIDMLRYASELNLRIFRVRAVVFFSLLTAVGAGILCAGSSKPAAKRVRAVNTHPIAVPERIAPAEKTCHNCGKAVQADQIFCDLCGTDLHRKPEPPKESRCPACGSVVDKNAAFCGCCGNAMGK